MRPDPLFAALQHHAVQCPTALALSDSQRQVDYAQLWREVEARAEQLRALQVPLLALALNNGCEALIWDLAALRAGVACLILPPFFSPAQRAHCLEQSGATLALAEGPFAEELAPLGFVAAGEFWRRESAPAGLPLPAGTAKITYTSGTTGAPKGVCLSAEAMLRVAAELELVSRECAPQRYMAVLPLAVLLENLGLYAALIAGATLHLPTQQELGMSVAGAVEWPKLFGQMVQRGCQSLILVPQLLFGLVVAVERGFVPAAGFRFIAVGGARVSPELLERAQRVGLPVFEGYGLSECASVVCLNRPGAQRPGTVGRPLPHVQVRLAEDGEVLVAGSTLLGYLGDEPFAGQWWPTGDIGEFDADGYLSLRGRKKHQFVTSFGRNVNPEWVEAELTQGGVLMQAFVYGESLPSNVALLWPLDPNCADAAIDAAVQKANAGLPDYARIGRWVRLDTPFSPANGLLTANGRPKRDAILARYREHFSEPVNA